MRDAKRRGIMVFECVARVDVGGSEVRLYETMFCVQHNVTFQFKARFWQTTTIFL